jgi:hypothetical protein
MPRVGMMRCTLVLSGTLMGLLRCRSSITQRIDVEFTFEGGKGPASLKSFLTDNENDLTYLGQVTAGNNGTLESTLPARSMVSFVGVSM